MSAAPVEFYGVGGEARLLAKQHVPAAVQRLVELMKCTGRQAHVAASACKAIIEIAEGSDADKIIKAVKQHLDGLLGEAERLEAVEQERARAALPPVTPDEDEKP